MIFTLCVQRVYTYAGECQGKVPLRPQYAKRKDLVEALLAA